VPFRDIAILIFREFIFYDVYYRKCCFVLFKRKLASQKVFALGAQNFVRFSTRTALTHRKNCRSLGLLGMMLFQYLEGSISMTHTVYIYLLLELERLTTGDAGTGQMVGGGRLRGVLQGYALYRYNSKTERRGGN
jgi:hypothetical protein